MDTRFEDQVVIITGGGSGIGAPAALRFASEGATVVVAGRTREKLEKVAAQASGAGTVVTRVVDARTKTRSADSSRRWPRDTAAWTSWSTTPALS